jgi:hypothetical protein
LFIVNEVFRLVAVEVIFFYNCSNKARSAVKLRCTTIN